MENFLYKLLFTIPSILIAFVVHEIAHGYVAYVFGDPTAKYQGRFSIDPRKHLDPIGAAVLLFSVLFTGMAFGWAKPVSVNPYNFRNPRQDMAWVAFAGPLSNFTMAALAGLLLKFGVITSMPILVLFIFTFVSVNVGLGLFNMIPVPPLDGSKILYGILPQDTAHKLMDMEQRYAMYIPFVVMFLIMTPIASSLIVIPYKFLLQIFTGIGL